LRQATTETTWSSKSSSGVIRSENFRKTANKYNQTCSKRSPLGQRKSGLI